MNKKGFTIIELLICVAIIGILVAIVLPIGMKLLGSNGSDVVTFNTEPATVVVSTPQVVVEDEIGNETIVENLIVEDTPGCSDGKRTIVVDGELYFLGKVKNTWGDLEGVPCE